MGVFVRVVFDRGVFYMGGFGLDPEILSYTTERELVGN